jgi:hypothetical protein
MTIVIFDGTTYIGLSEGGTILAGRTPRGRSLLRVERAEQVDVEPAGSDAVVLDGRPLEGRARLGVGDELHVANLTVTARAPAPTRSEASLRVTGLFVGTRARVDSSEPRIIGSGADAGIRLTEGAGIRPHHARLYFEGQSLHVAGVEGTVRVNGTEVGEAALNEGDVVEIGAASVTIHMIVSTP